MSIHTIDIWAAESQEVHEYLDKHGIPRIKHSSDGQLVDENGEPYYIIPLIDRVLMWKALG